VIQVSPRPSGDDGREVAGSWRSGIKVGEEAADTERVRDARNHAPASVSMTNREAPAADEIRASAAEQSALAPLLNLSPSSRDADTPLPRRAATRHGSPPLRFRPDAAHRVEPRWAFAVACALPATTRGRARRVRARFLRRPRDRRRHGPGAVQSVASALPLVLFGEARPFVLGVTHLSRAPGTRTTRARRGRATQ
jgi:hypothetical protein